MLATVAVFQRAAGSLLPAMLLHYRCAAAHPRLPARARAGARSSRCPPYSSMMCGDGQADGSMAWQLGKEAAVGLLRRGAVVSVILSPVPARPFLVLRARAPRRSAPTACARARGIGGELDKSWC